jgi:hypothetical protein
MASGADGTGRSGVYLDFGERLPRIAGGCVTIPRHTPKQKFNSGSKVFPEAKSVPHTSGARVAQHEVRHQAGFRAGGQRPVWNVHHLCRPNAV